MSNWKPKTTVLRRRTKVGAILRRYREEAKLSYRQLARSSRINHATLHSLEIGRGRLETQQLAALEMVYGRAFTIEILGAIEKKGKVKHAGN